MPLDSLRSAQPGRQVAARPQPVAGVLGCLDGYLVDFNLRALRHGNFEDTVLELGGRLLCLHRRRQGDGAYERAIAELSPMVVLVFFLFFLFHFPFHG